MSGIFWLLVDTLSLLAVYVLGFFYPLYLSLKLINVDRRPGFVLKKEADG